MPTKPPNHLWPGAYRRMLDTVKAPGRNAGPLVLGLAALCSWILLIAALLPIRQGYEAVPLSGLVVSAGGIWSAWLAANRSSRWRIWVVVAAAAFLAWYLILTGYSAHLVSSWRPETGVIENLKYVVESKGAVVTAQLHRVGIATGLLTAYREFVMPIVQLLMLVLVIRHRPNTKGAPPPAPSSFTSARH
jgi:hypothetical protein